MQGVVLFFVLFAGLHVPGTTTTATTTTTSTTVLQSWLLLWTTGAVAL